MERKRDISLKDALKSDESFFEFLKQGADSDEYRHLKRRVEKEGPHPADEMLHDYVLGWLDEQDAKMVRAHILICGLCTDEILRLTRIESELDENAMGDVKGPDSRKDSLQSETNPDRLKKIIEKIKTRLSRYAAPKMLATAMIGVCLVFVFAISRPDLSETTLSVLTQKASSPTRGQASSEEIELEEGGRLGTGASFWIKIGAEKDAYAYVLFYESSGKIIPLPDKKPIIVREAKPDILYEESDKGLQLNDDQTGTQRVFLLTSETAIDDFDRKLEELRKSGIDEIEKVFPEASVRSFHFRHE